MERTTSTATRQGGSLRRLTTASTDLFALDRLDHLLTTAPGHDGQVKLADTGLERPEQRPRYDRRLAPLERDLAARRLHVHIYGVHLWGPPPLKDACERLFAELAPAGDRVKPLSVIRIFGPGVPWAVPRRGRALPELRRRRPPPLARARPQGDGAARARGDHERPALPRAARRAGGAARRRARRRAGGAGPSPALRRAPRRRAGRLALPRLVDACVGGRAQGRTT